MHFDWKLQRLVCALILLGGCGRSRLAIGDEPAFDLVGGQRAGTTGAGSAGVGPGTGAVGGIGPGGPATGGVPGIPIAGTPAGPAGRGGAGSAGVGGRGGSFAPPGSGRDAPPPPPPPDMPDDIDNPNVLNPQRCATDRPFVLSIDPGGDTGHVQGWLESAPAVLFDENDLPRFGAFAGPGDSSSDLALWWSIASTDDGSGGGGSLWFYAANSSTEVVHVPVNRPAAIGDASTLSYTSWSVGPVAVGEMAVFHHIPSDRYLAVHAVDLYGTETGDRRAECTAIDARWVFAPEGSSDFTRR